VESPSNSLRPSSPALKPLPPSLRPPRLRARVLRLRPRVCVLYPRPRACAQGCCPRSAPAICHLGTCPAKPSAISIQPSLTVVNGNTMGLLDSDERDILRFRRGARRGKLVSLTESHGTCIWFQQWRESITRKTTYWWVKWSPGPR
jgi:hypothetical protein